MFVTSEPTPLVAACGGVLLPSRPGKDFTDSCLVLDQINQRWDETTMGSLTESERAFGAPVQLNGIGVFIVGGGTGGKSTSTSEFLAEGTMQWQEGPALPVDMVDVTVDGCAVGLTDTSFLVIDGTHIWEFDAATAGPTGGEGWKAAGYWPALKTSRRHSGCAKIGQKVIIAGGSEKLNKRSDGEVLSSTEVLDLVSRQILPGEDMATPRVFFHVATIIIEGEEKTFAVGGSRSTLSDRRALYNPDSYFLNTVEEWVEESSTWKAADNLVANRAVFGAAVVPRELVCPA